MQKHGHISVKSLGAGAGEVDLLYKGIVQWAMQGGHGGWHAGDLKTCMAGVWGGPGSVQQQ